MAVYIAGIVAGTPEPLDALCPQCWLPSMVCVPILSITDTGVSTFGTWTGCVHCDARRTRRP